MSLPYPGPTPNLDPEGQRKSFLYAHCKNLPLLTFRPMEETPWHPDKPPHGNTLTGMSYLRETFIDSNMVLRQLYGIKIDLWKPIKTLGDISGFPVEYIVKNATFRQVQKPQIIRGTWKTEELIYRYYRKCLMTSPHLAFSGPKSSVYVQSQNSLWTILAKQV